MGQLANIAKALGAALIGLIVAVTLVEAIPRALPGLMPKKVQAVQRLYDARNSWESMMRGDRELGFVLRPDLVLSFPSEGRSIDIRTSPLPVSGMEGMGFRDIGTKPPYDAIALGDSFTFCDDSPAESCWVRKLGEKTGLSIATLGVNGYSNLAEARLLDKVAGLAPKVVLVGFFPNDFKDNLHFSNWAKSDTDDYWTWMRRKRRSDVSEVLADNSIFYRLFDAARRYGKRDTFEHKQDDLDFVFRADAWWRFVLEQPGETPGFKLAEEAFETMAARARAMNAQLVVLMFPFKEQVYWDVARHYYKDIENLPSTDMDEPFRILRTSLERRGIAVCDLTPEMRERARSGPQLYLRVGAHWTDAGNEAAADVVAGCLARLQIGEASRRADAGADTGARAPQLERERS